MIIKKRLKALFCYEYFIECHSTDDKISLKRGFEAVNIMLYNAN